MKPIILTLLAILVYVTQTFSTGPEWISRYNGTANSADWSYALLLDQAGNVYVTGYSTGAGTGKDYKTIKYSPLGVIIWQATFNGPVNGGDYSNAMALDASGNVYVTGRVDYGNPSSDIVTIKYNSQGVQQWFARYSGSANNVDEGKCIQVDNAGNVYVGGRSYVTGTGFDFITIKYNPDGSESWVSTYNGPANTDDYIASLALDNSGNVYVGGGSIGIGTGQDFTLVKYNSAGAEQWVKRYNGAANGGDLLVTVKVDVNGDIVGAGYADMGMIEKYNIIAIKYSPNGTQQWVSQYNGPSSHMDYATAMDVDANSDIYITGVSARIVGPVVDSNYVTLKYNPSGQLQWASVYYGPNNSVDISRAIFVDNTGNVYITGSSVGVNSNDYVTIKYSPLGTSVWLMSYNGPGNADDFSTSMAADNNGNVFVTGRSYGSGTDFDYATIKYSDLVGITPVSNEIPDRFNLYQNYPNPFNPSTKIKFDLPEESNVILNVYNSVGEEVYSKSFGELRGATYEYIFSTNNLTSGVYFYKIITNSYSQSKKMVLVK